MANAKLEHARWVQVQSDGETVSDLSVVDSLTKLADELKTYGLPMLGDNGLEMTDYMPTMGSYISDRADELRNLIDVWWEQKTGTPASRSEGEES